MGLTYNGVSPTEIKYNDTSLTTLKYGDEYIWSKPYSLTINQGSNTSVVVTRTSSPYQHATTGELSTGSVIYYGDVLKISATANTGYNLLSFLVNNTTWTSGNTIEVTSAITITSTAEVSASWKTIYTGSSSVSNKSTTMFAPTKFSPTIFIPSGTTYLKITGDYLYNGSTSTLNGRVINVGKTSATQTTIVSGKITVLAQQNAYFFANVKAYATNNTSRITLTKVEAYY